MRPHLPLIIFAALQAGDVMSTGYALQHGGIEANPIAVWVLAQGGLIALAFVKATAVAYAGLIGQVCGRTTHGYRAWDFVIRAASVLYVLVVVSNLIVGGLI